jgi:uncharacterized Tic20 family protein
MANPNDRLLAVLSHVLAIVPGVGILGPLVIYLVKKDESEFVVANARESLNFQLTIILLYIICWILVLFLVGIFIIWLIPVMNALLVIVASIKASEDKVYRYPISIRLIR